MTTLAPSQVNDPSQSNAAAGKPAGQTEGAPVGKVLTEVAGCPECGSTEPWGRNSWCPSCGYYPLLKATAKAPKKSEMEANVAENVWQAIPIWAWVLAVVGIAILAGSLAVGQKLESAGDRARWAVLQILLGTIAALSAQWVVYFNAVTFSEKFGPMDFFMKPLAIWEPTMRQLPKGAWRLWFGGWGVTAVFGAVVLIGGMDYNALFDDWGVEKRATKNLVQAVTDQARQEREGGADSLEDAINDFAGEAEDQIPEETRDISKLPFTDCLIVGYSTLGDNAKEPFQTLFLATMVGKQLKYVGSLGAECVPEGPRRELNERMSYFRRKTPFVDTPHEAHWLKPTIMIQVAFDDWTPAKTLKNPVFKAMLADVK